MRKINPYANVSVGIRLLDAAIIAMLTLLGVLICVHF